MRKTLLESGVSQNFSVLTLLTFWDNTLLIRARCDLSPSSNNLNASGLQKCLQENSHPIWEAPTPKRRGQINEMQMSPAVMWRAAQEEGTGSHIEQFRLRMEITLCLRKICLPILGSLTLPGLLVVAPNFVK